MTHFRISFNHSWVLIFSAVILHLLSLFVVCFYFESVRLFLILFLLFLSFSFFLFSYFFYYRKVLVIRLEPNGKTEVLIRNHSFSYAKISSINYLTSWLINIVWEIDGRKVRQIILRDMVDEAEFRQLFLWLKWDISEG